jgi:hypothetical protein
MKAWVVAKSKCQVKSTQKLFIVQSFLILMKKVTTFFFYLTDCDAYFNLLVKN